MTHTPSLSCRRAVRLAALTWLTAAGCTSSVPSGPDAATSDAAAKGDAAGTTPRDAAAPADAAASPDGALPPDLSPGTPATITVTRTSPLTALDSTFAGLSYEKATIPTPLFSGANADLIALCKRLGPSVLRVGGNSVDKNTWSASGAGLQPGTIAPPDVDRLAAFLKAAGWQVIYGVNMGQSTPAAAAAEATYAAQSLGASLLGFEIGNEPDLYAGEYRPANYTFADFKTEWESFAAAIRAKVPAAPLTGPAAAYNYKVWTVPFAADEASRISLLTQHYYLANGMDASSTIQKLLLPDPNLIAELAALKPAAAAAKIAGGFRLAEANSYYNGGAAGVSDSFGSALWAIDFLFTLAQGGATGVNFHGGGNGPGYTPIANQSTGQVVGPRPEYYGISVFDLAAQGKLLTTKVTVTGVALSAYAVEPADGSTAVVLVNKDSTEFVHATVDLGKAATAATLTALTAPALDSTTGVLLGGAPINADGTWTPVLQPSVQVAGQIVTVDVAPASALLISAK